MATLLNQVQTGLHNAPNFNGYYFQIAEATSSSDDLVLTDLSAL